MILNLTLWNESEIKYLKNQRLKTKKWTEVHDTNYDSDKSTMDQIVHNVCIWYNSFII